MNDFDELTLDPPGTIAVIGGGPLGVEASLYGRYLGYEVTLFETHTVGHSGEPKRNEPLPILPDQCLSSLAISALSAQHHESGPQVLPMTYGQWIDEGLGRLCQSDLLRGRVREHTAVQMIEMKPVETDDEDPDDVPDDFCLHLRNEGGDETAIFESVIIATGQGGEPKIANATDTSSVDYLFRITGNSDDLNSNDLNAHLRAGYRQISKIFASLMGREDLDLYRPKRV
ncbi:NAD(P)/FAD-dependent oxidoreductase [Rubripirellula amarantea]|nr:hypothetical protein [Rubripirellula amarantea]